MASNEVPYESTKTMKNEGYGTFKIKLLDQLTTDVCLSLATYWSFPANITAQFKEDARRCGKIMLEEMETRGKIEAGDISKLLTALEMQHYAGMVTVLRTSFEEEPYGKFKIDLLNQLTMDVCIKLASYWSLPPAIIDHLRKEDIQCGSGYTMMEEMERRGKIRADNISDLLTALEVMGYHGIVTILRKSFAMNIQERHDCTTDEEGADISRHKRAQNDVAFPEESLELDQEAMKAFQSRYQSDFKHQEFLGAGSFGNVFKAQNTLDGSSYAIKRISSRQGEAERGKALREARALAQLEHNNIVRYYQVWEEEPPEGWQEKYDQHLMGADTGPSSKSYLYIQMELCQKENLKDFLENTAPRNRKEVLHIFQQILEAVDYIHKKKMIHRDLKPSNIFFSVDASHVVKIGDFGLVTTMDTDIHTLMVGTRLYMSPEQLAGDNYDHKIDIYALGLIFFELLFLFSTEMKRVTVLQKVKSKEYPWTFVAEMPREKKLVEWMLSSDPTNRPNTDDVIKSEIFTALLVESRSHSASSMSSVNLK